MPVEVNLRGILKNAIQLNDAIEEGAYNAGVMIRDLAAQLAPYDESNTSEKHLSEDGEVHRADLGAVITFGEGLRTKHAAPQEYGFNNVLAEVFVEGQPYVGPAVKAIDISLEVAKEIRKIL